MAHRVLLKQSVNGYTLEQLEHTILLHWIDADAGNFLPYLDMQFTNAHGLTMQRATPSAITHRLDVYRGKKTVGVVFLVSRRGEQVEVNVAQNDGEAFGPPLAELIVRLAGDAGQTPKPSWTAGLLEPDQVMAAARGFDRGSEPWWDFVFSWHTAYTKAAGKYTQEKLAGLTGYSLQHLNAMSRKIIVL